MLISRRVFIESGVAGAVASFVSATGMTAQPRSAHPTDLSLQQASDLVRRRKISPVELTQACLSRIDQLNPSLNAFITVTGDQAMIDAKQAERDIQLGRWRGPLHGIPISLKDLFDTAGVKTTAASGLFKERVPTDDAEVVRRLKASGAVLLGKTNMHEFAYGGTSLISYFGAVHNPWNLDYIAGGSSGGSAAAVAGDLCYASVGSDTGGSIRQPAACCGLVGLKPTYGLISTRGAIPLSWSVDHVGPLARTVADAALLLQAMAGHDSQEPTSASIRTEDYVTALRAPLSGVRLGVARDFFFVALDPEIDAAVAKAIGVLEHVTRSRAQDVKIDAAAADEVRVTVRAAEAYAYHADWVSKTAALYLPYTVARIKTGANITTGTYIRARRELEQVRQRIGRTFQTVDVLITPTTQVPAVAIAQVPSDIDAAIALEKPLMRNTSPFNAYGLPTISVPCGFTRAGLPIGLQITGPAGGDALVLRVAHAYEQATDWHTRTPNAISRAT